ncbi:hypothetical protein UY3_15609 [Chelonia mydas]|uniref:Uncharacterized protein n=1 Tax=Chelonia mydas TaxID=8469 RepID=M7APW3_CHEMY|nr:hypothetical protein UY3_15609 [Chelonia mydas]
MGLIEKPQKEHPGPGGMPRASRTAIEWALERDPAPAPANAQPLTPDGYGPNGGIPRNVTPPLIPKNEKWNCRDLDRYLEQHLDLDLGQDDDRRREQSRVRDLLLDGNRRADRWRDRDQCRESEQCCKYNWRCEGKWCRDCEWRREWEKCQEWDWCCGLSNGAEGWIRASRTYRHRCLGMRLRGCRCLHGNKIPCSRKGIRGGRQLDLNHALCRGVQGHRTQRFSPGGRSQWCRSRRLCP